MCKKKHKYKVLYVSFNLQSVGLQKQKYKALYFQTSFELFNNKLFFIDVFVNVLFAKNSSQSLWMGHIGTMDHKPPLKIM